MYGDGQWPSQRLDDESVTACSSSTSLFVYSTDCRPVILLTYSIDCWLIVLHSHFEQRISHSTLKNLAAAPFHFRDFR